MSYTKKYKVQLVSIIAAIILILTMAFAVGLCRYAYKRGLEDGLLYKTQLLQDSTRLTERLRLKNGY